jgi:hypothetical protein
MTAVSIEVCGRPGISTNEVPGGRGSIDAPLGHKGALNDGLNLGTMPIGDLHIFGPAKRLICNFDTVRCRSRRYINGVEVV